MALLGMGSLQFDDAKDLWGKHTYLTEDEVLKKANQKGAGILVIGPAGENLVRYAVIVNDYPSGFRIEEIDRRCLEN